MTEPQLDIVIHDLAQGRAVLALAGARVREIRSAPGAAGAVGVGYLVALGEALGRAMVVDCGSDAGLVMAALRAGARMVVFGGAADVARRLGEMAEQVGAELRHEAQPPPGLVRLAAGEDPARRLATVLGKASSPGAGRDGAG